MFGSFFVEYLCNLYIDFKILITCCDILFYFYITITTCNLYTKNTKAIKKIFFKYYKVAIVQILCFY